MALVGALRTFGAPVPLTLGVRPHQKNEVPIHKALRMRLLFLLLVAIPFWANATTGPLQPERNLAYEDDFVWYLSGRLANQLIELQLRSGIKMSRDEEPEHRAQYEILYHHYLVECKGPLPRLAESLKFFTLVPADTATSALQYVGRMESSIWPVVRDWNNEVLLRLLDTYSRGKYGFFPACIVSGYKKQNPIPGIASQ